MTDARISRDEVIAYLRWLADCPEGIEHRAWLFHAALIIARDRDTIFMPQQERHGEEAI